MKSMDVHAKTTEAKLIGLTGYATAGKDAFADVLVSEFGYVKMGWSDRLCDVALAINPILWCGWRPRRLSSVVGSIGWTAAKRYSSVRRYLQWLGTDVCRKYLSEDVWVNAAMPEILKNLRAGRSVVITNCRFRNEVAAIEARGGNLVLVERPGVGPVNDHASESGEVFEKAVFRVINDQGLENLVEWAEALEAALGNQHPNPDMNMIPFMRAIQRGIARGVGLVLQTCAPESDVADEWMKRHRVHCDLIDDGVEVFVDGRSAGRVRYSDNILEIDAKIAR